MYLFRSDGQQNTLRLLFDHWKSIAALQSNLTLIKAYIDPWQTRYCIPLMKRNEGLRLALVSSHLKGKCFYMSMTFQEPTYVYYVDNSKFVETC